MACFLESQKVNVDKQLSWHSLKKHLTNNYSEIPYETHAIKAYSNLHQGSDESTSAYLHRVQDILECIHHTTNKETISAIGTNHVKILTGLKDGRNKTDQIKSKEMNQYVSSSTRCSQYGHQLQKVPWLFTSYFQSAIHFIKCI